MASTAGQAPSTVRSARGEAIVRPSADRSEDQLDRLARDAYLATHVADGRFTQETEQLCRSHGVSQAQFTVLWVLCVSDDPNGLAIGAIADGLLTRAGDTSRLVDRLVAAELAVRETSPDDRRVARVRPTSKGRRLFTKLVAAMNALHREQWAALDGDELTQLISLINKALWSASGPLF